MTIQRVFGIDASSSIAGFCILDVDPAKVSSLEAFAAVLHLAEARICGRDKLEKIQDIGEKVEDLFERFHPTTAAVEAGYVGRNPSTCLLLGEIRGACYYAARRHTSDVYSVDPNAVRSAIGLQGKFGKREVVKLKVLERVIQMLRLKTAPRENAADAAAVALWAGLKVSEPVPF